MVKHRTFVPAFVAVLAVTISACGASADPVPRGPVASPPSTVALPDLTDPEVRQRFAESFSEGYFVPPTPVPDHLEVVAQGFGLTWTRTV